MSTKLFDEYYTSKIDDKEASQEQTEQENEQTQPKTEEIYTPNVKILPIKSAISEKFAEQFAFVINEPFEFVYARLTIRNCMLFLYWLCVVCFFIKLAKVCVANVSAPVCIPQCIKAAAVCNIEFRETTYT